MSSPRDLAARSADGGAALADYLDHLCAPLVDVMPYPERQAVRQEIGDHLRALAAAGEELGTAPSEALAQALRRFGPPRAIRNAIRRERAASASPHSRSRAAALGAGVALGVIGITALLSNHRLVTQLEYSTLALSLLFNAVWYALLGGMLGFAASRWNLGPGKSALCGTAFFSLAFAAPIAGAYAWNGQLPTQMVFLGLVQMTLRQGLVGMLCGGFTHALIDHRLRPGRFRLQSAGALEL